MNQIVLYCKSFAGDLNRVQILNESIIKYNLDNIPFYISVPSADMHMFEKLENAILIKDEDIFNINSSKQGWFNQQLIKSNFWKLGLCENYVCIDSDSYFIRPFGISDFMYDENVSYTVMHEQKELFSWSVNKTSMLGFDPKEGFVNDRLKIMNLFERKSRYYDFGPSPVIWSAAVWRWLDDNYITPNNLTFENLLEYSSSEFSWYGEALLKSKIIDIYPTEPLFKVFHYPQQYMEYKQHSISEEMIAANYMGIVMQSNFNAPLTY